MPSFQQYLDAFRKQRIDPGSVIEQVVPQLVPGWSTVFAVADFLGDLFTGLFGGAPKKLQFSTTETPSEDQLRQLAATGIQVVNRLKLEGGPTLTVFDEGFAPVPYAKANYLPGPLPFEVWNPEDYARLTGGPDMAFNLAPFIQGITGVVGAAGQQLGNPLLQQVAGIGSSFAQAFLPTPSITGSFVPQPQIQAPVAPPVVQTMSAAPAVRATSALAVQTAMLLAKVRARFGKNLSLSAALSRIRSLGKVLEPTVVASAVGLTAAELASLIVAGSARKRRRMNPANVHALRRSARRIESFHKLCSRVDVLRSRRSRSSRSICTPRRRRRK